MEGTTLIEVEILGVTQKQATRKSDGQPFTMYEIQVTDGTQEGSAVYSTTFVEAANEAFALIGKHAKLGVKIQQNGHWINRYLQKVYGEITTPTGGSSTNGGGFLGNGSAPVQQSQTIPSQSTVTSHGADLPEALRPDPSIVVQANAFDVEKQKQIHRQTACKVAAMLFVAGDSQVDFWDNVDSLIRFFDTGVKPLSVEMYQETRS